jgi:hypothetical protein
MTRKRCDDEVKGGKRVVESVTFVRIRKLIEDRDVLVSSHGYDELAEDGIMIKDLLSSIESAVVIEDYPDFGKGPCCLVRHRDEKGDFIHAVWGIPKGHKRPAVLITAYRPDPQKWTENYTRRV